ncbi:hypothetical protein KW787_01460 [Candidatus Pacearchaeota archaeon]|nr:hypothetical protein [Candidatus Pacearchaeota archaeon]
MPDNMYNGLENIAKGQMKTLSLVKGNQYYCFRYELGQESKVLDALVEMVHKPDSGFDWFDAGILSHQLGRHLAKELKKYQPNKAA